MSSKPGDKDPSGDQPAPEGSDEGSTVLGMPAFAFEDDEPAPEPHREPAKPSFETSPFVPAAPAPSPFAPTAPVSGAIPSGTPLPEARAPEVTDPDSLALPQRVIPKRPRPRPEPQPEPQAQPEPQPEPASLPATQMAAHLPVDDGATMMQAQAPAIEEMQTMLKPAMVPAELMEEQATMLRPAMPVRDPQEDQPTMMGVSAMPIRDPQEDQATMMGVSAMPIRDPQEDQPTMMKMAAPELAEDDDEPTQLKNPEPKRGRSSPRNPALPPQDKPGKPAKAAKGGESPTQSTVNLPGQSKRPQLGIQVVIGALLLLLAVAGAAKFLVGPSRPSTSELRMLYPYGEAGGPMPNGRVAPRAEDVEFTYVREMDCGGEPCMTYLVSPANGGFSMEMTVVRRDGRWVNMNALK